MSEVLICDGVPTLVPCGGKNGDGDLGWMLQTCPQLGAHGFYSGGTGSYGWAQACDGYSMERPWGYETETIINEQVL